MGYRRYKRFAKKANKEMWEIMNHFEKKSRQELKRFDAGHLIVELVYEIIKLRYACKKMNDAMDMRDVRADYKLYVTEYPEE